MKARDAVPDAARDAARNVEVPRQLTLDLPFRPALAREDFAVADCNALAVGWVDRWPDWPGAGLILYGPEGCGKSHLAAVWRAASGADAPGEGALDLEAGRDLAERGGALLLEDIDVRLAAVPARGAANPTATAASSPTRNQFLANHAPMRAEPAIATHHSGPAFATHSPDR